MTVTNALAYLGMKLIRGVKRVEWLFIEAAFHQMYIEGCHSSKAPFIEKAAKSGVIHRIC